MKAISTMIAIVLLTSITIGAGGLVSLFFIDTTQTSTRVVSNVSESLTSCSTAAIDVPKDSIYCVSGYNLVVLAHLDEGSGNITVDSSGNGNNHALRNFNFNSVSGWTAGKYGNALLFDGVNDYVNIGNGTNLNLTSTGTVEAWVKRAGDSQTKSLETILVKGNYHLDVFSQKPRFILGNYSNNVDNTSDLNINGIAAGDYLGEDVTLGDVNGDGYTDIIAGAIYSDAGGSDSGSVYIFYGGPNMDTTADVTLVGEAADNEFGIEVATADINRDGYSDVIVGADLNDAGGADAGRAYLYYGGSNMDNVSDVTFTGAAAGDWFGIGVASAGDVNGDGYPDIIIGGRSNDAGGADAGRAYIFYGNTSMDNTTDVTLTGAAAGDNFGDGVASAGDVNGDGYSDVIVGAYGVDAGGTDAGRAYLYYGGSNMDTTADVIFTGESANDFLAIVASAGDVNGDGYSDAIIGAAAANTGLGGDSGRAYLLYGGTSMDNVADVIFTGEAANNYFGVSFASADVNGDGYSDVIVGAHQNTVGSGKAYVFYGGTSMDNSSDITFYGQTLNDLFGIDVATGDVNGDGYPDVVVGAEANGAGGDYAGRLYNYQASVNIAESSTTITNNTWHHLAGTFDGSTVRVYVDGISSGNVSRSNNIQSTTANLSIGIFRDLATNEFNGTIDEVRIYSRALSASEVKQHYESGITELFSNKSYVKFLLKNNGQYNLRKTFNFLLSTSAASNSSAITLNNALNVGDIQLVTLPNLTMSTLSVSPVQSIYVTSSICPNAQLTITDLGMDC